MIHPQTLEKSSEIDVQVQPQDSHREVGVHGVEQPVFSLSSHTHSGLAGNQEQSKASFMRAFDLLLLCVERLDLCKQ